MSFSTFRKPFTIAIVGGGFSGCLTAINLMRRPTGELLKIVLIERSRRIAKGVAYGTMCPLHLLNVPAKDMSALPEDSDHFFNWAQKQDPAIDRDTFVSRMEFGKYIERLLNDTIEHLPPNIQFSLITDEVREISEAEHSAILRLADDITEVSADRVVLALGNLAPANIRLEDPSFYESNRYVRNPWSKDCFSGLAPSDTILLIGTGLTMVDKALELRASGHKGQIHALSRHGFLPNTHLASSHTLSMPIDLSNTPSTALGALVWIRRMIKDAEISGANWRQVIESLRPVTQEIWSGWDEHEKKRFVRHLRCFWDVHRHGIAPEIGAAISEMLKNEQLVIHAGRVISLVESDSQVIVTLRRRGHQATEPLTVDRVINCTGADSNIRTIDDQLVAQLREKGILVSDSLGLGPVVNEDWALVDAHGQASSVLYAVGPLLKGLLWESIAVPELRTQAARLADLFLKSNQTVVQIAHEEL